MGEEYDVHGVDELDSVYGGMDARVQEWAKQIVTYSTEVQEGEFVRIVAPVAPRESHELAMAVQAYVLEAGGNPKMEWYNDESDRLFYLMADKDQLEHLPDYTDAKAEETDARVVIMAPENEAALNDVPGMKQQLRSLAQQHLHEESVENTKWCLTQFPTKALAQKAGMSYPEYRNFVLDACVRDWAEETEKYMALKDVVDVGSTVRIVGEDTDLEMDIGVRDGVNSVGVPSDGTKNVPGGEVFTAPKPESVKGEIYFDVPAFVKGKTVKGVRLTFEDGEIVDYSAESGEDLLADLIDTDDGSRYLGELGIGTNFGIEDWTKDTLFDEKIGGTIHCAIGRAYQENLEIDSLSLFNDIAIDLSLDEQAALADELMAEASQFLDGDADGYDEWVRSLPNTHRQLVGQYRQAREELARQHNDSAVHQDFVKDLRNGGRLEIDGEVILENGSFVGVDTLP